MGFPIRYWTYFAYHQKEEIQSKEKEGKQIYVQYNKISKIY